MGRSRGESRFRRDGQGAALMLAVGGWRPGEGFSEKWLAAAATS
jgi:hypothetical protein